MSVRTTKWTLCAILVGGVISNAQAIYQLRQEGFSAQTPELIDMNTLPECEGVAAEFKVIKIGENFYQVAGFPGQRLIRRRSQTIEAPLFLRDPQHLLCLFGLLDQQTHPIFDVMTLGSIRHI